MNDHLSTNELECDTTTIWLDILAFDLTLIRQVKGQAIIYPTVKPSCSNVHVTSSEGSRRPAAQKAKQRPIYYLRRRRSSVARNILRSLTVGGVWAGRRGGWRGRVLTKVTDSLMTAHGSPTPDRAFILAADKLSFFPPY